MLELLATATDATPLMAPSISGTENWQAILPAASLAIGALLVMIVGLFTRRNEDSDLALFYTALGGALLSLITCIDQLAKPVQYAWAGSIRADGLAAFLGIVISAAVLLTVLISHSYHKRLRANLADYLTLILFSGSGMMLLAYANELVTIFVGVELMSIPIYILVGVERGNERANEASIKYLVLGGLASAFLLMGLVMLYGSFCAVADATGGSATTLLTDLSPLAEEANTGSLPLAVLALGLLIVGFGFKVGAAPFHQWVPDVYEGAPTAVTGFMAVAVKAATFGVLLRVLLYCFPAAAPGMLADDGGTYLVNLGEYTGTILWIICALTIITGNLLALSQTNIKRMLAYSSIAHSGYILLGVIAVTGSATSTGGWEILFYLLVYAFMNLGAFAIVIIAGRDDEDYERIDQLQGLAHRQPFIGLALVIAMFSLAGIPLTGGFVGKFGIFYTAIANGQIALSVIGIIGSLIGLYYYLRVIYVVYMKPPVREGEFESNPDRFSIRFAISITAIATVVLGIFPFPFINWARTAVETLRQGAGF